MGELKPFKIYLIYTYVEKRFFDVQDRAHFSFSGLERLNSSNRIAYTVKCIKRPNSQMFPAKYIFRADKQTINDLTVNLFFPPSKCSTMSSRTRPNSLWSSLKMLYLASSMQLSGYSTLQSPQHLTRIENTTGLPIHVWPPPSTSLPYWPMSPKQRHAHEAIRTIRDQKVNAAWSIRWMDNNFRISKKGTGQTKKRRNQNCYNHRFILNLLYRDE